MDRRTARYCWLCTDFHELISEKDHTLSNHHKQVRPTKAAPQDLVVEQSLAISVSLPGNWSNFIKFLAEAVDGSPRNLINSRVFGIFIDQMKMKREHGPIG